MPNMPNINQLALSGVIEAQPVCRDGFVERTVACRRIYMEARHVEVLNKHRQHDEQEPCPTTATMPC